MNVTLRGAKAKIGLIIALAMIVAGGVLYSLLGGEKQDTAAVAVMDTAAVVKVWGAEADPYAQRLKELDEVFSAYDTDAELYRLNQSGGGTASATLAAVLGMAVRYNALCPTVDVTCGALIDLWGISSDNPRVPSDAEIAQAMKTVGADKLTVSGSAVTIAPGTKVELGCCAKGYACDVLYEMLRDNGVDCAVVTMDSSALLYGEKPDGSPFSVSVKDPDDENAVMGSFTTGACFVSTAGGYERNFTSGGVTYSHIFDLATGKPAVTDLTSVTVVTDSGFASDFIDTAVYIAGSAGLAPFLSGTMFPDLNYEVIAVTDTHKVYVSDGLRDSFSITDPNFTLAQ
ncbi:MAG: FAD:protein FMN transferase [Oscillospiraceae bacterium]